MLSQQQYLVELVRIESPVLGDGVAEYLAFPSPAGHLPDRAYQHFKFLQALFLWACAVSSLGTVKVLAQFVDMHAISEAEDDEEFDSIDLSLFSPPYIWGPPVFSALANRNFEVVRWLTDQEISPDARAWVHVPDDLETEMGLVLLSPLQMAILQGDWESVMTIVECGCAVAVSEARTMANVFDNNHVYDLLQRRLCYIYGALSFFEDSLASTIRGFLGTCVMQPIEAPGLAVLRHMPPRSLEADWMSPFYQLLAACPGLFVLQEECMEGTFSSHADSFQSRLEQAWVIVFLGNPDDAEAYAKLTSMGCAALQIVPWSDDITLLWGQRDEVVTFLHFHHLPVITTVVEVSKILLSITSRVTISRTPLLEGNPRRIATGSNTLAVELLRSRSGVPLRSVPERVLRARYHNSQSRSQTRSNASDSSRGSNGSTSKRSQNSKNSKNKFSLNNESKVNNSSHSKTSKNNSYGKHSSRMNYSPRSLNCNVNYHLGYDINHLNSRTNHDGNHTQNINNANSNFNNYSSNENDECTDHNDGLQANDHLLNVTQQKNNNNSRSRDNSFEFEKAIEHNKSKSKFFQHQSSKSKSLTKYGQSATNGVMGFLNHLRGVSSGRNTHQSTYNGVKKLSQAQDSRLSTDTTSAGTAPTTTVGPRSASTTSILRSTQQNSNNSLLSPSRISSSPSPSSSSSSSSPNGEIMMNGPPKKSTILPSPLSEPFPTSSAPPASSASPPSHRAPAKKKKSSFSLVQCLFKCIWR